MRKLWSDHVIWTRDYVVNAVAGSESADESAQRLLRNQEDIGKAIVPYYGADAGNKLTTLLKEHELLWGATTLGGSLSLLAARAVWLRRRRAARFDVGDPAPSFAPMPTATGGQLGVAELGDARCVVLVFMSNACHGVKAYDKRLRALHERFAIEGVLVVGVNPVDETVHPGEGLDAARVRARWQTEAALPRADRRRDGREPRAARVPPGCHRGGPRWPPRRSLRDGSAGLRDRILALVRKRGHPACDRGPERVIAGGTVQAPQG